jgi:hypothetical protein
MAPQPKTPIAVVAEVMGAYKIVVVVQRTLSWTEMQRIRASGQLDCGKRQYLSPLQVSNLPGPVIDKLFELNLIDQDTDVLEFGSAMFGTGDAKADAQRCAEVIAQMAPFELILIDRTIPCS